MSIEQHILARATIDRLHSGVEVLTSGNYHIHIVRQNVDEIKGQVTNWKAADYIVTLTATRVVCECKDNRMNGNTCKHAVALALYAIRNPPLPQCPPDLTLATVRRLEITDAPF